MIFIVNSAPGVGKSTSLKLLQQKLPDGFALLDGDDVGRTVPYENKIEWLNLIQDNMISCCINYTAFGSKNIILSFVFPTMERINRIKEKLQNVGFEVCHIALYSDNTELERRIRERNTSKLINIEAAQALNQNIRSLPSDFKLNTTNLNKTEAADELYKFIIEHLS